MTEDATLKPNKRGRGSILFVLILWLILIPLSATIAFEYANHVINIAVEKAHMLPYNP